MRRIGVIVLLVIYFLSCVVVYGMQLKVSYSTLDSASVQNTAVRGRYRLTLRSYYIRYHLEQIRGQQAQGPERPRHHFQATGQIVDAAILGSLNSAVICENAL
ncbi:hypothetical protein M758_9G040900 [Ceratodon purpureus]|uniref:Uncharacterized protein n=1 Tax=Ceratodon purpureus TaxID=3225 RepID=A0A8T0GW35_CERPU|nr:hypothetical protein KC19_9G040200 [Ceratodon purpureus]KAG0605220.1 hypothetical protein M758_9G040900 [Ceratodon purpureus]